MIVGVLVAMPWDEKNSIKHGPGIAVVIVGWALVIFGNSLEFQEKYPII